MDANIWIDDLGPFAGSVTKAMGNMVIVKVASAPVQDDFLSTVKRVRYEESQGVVSCLISSLSCERLDGGMMKLSIEARLP